MKKKEGIIIGNILMLAISSLLESVFEVKEIDNIDDVEGITDQLLAEEYGYVEN